MAIEVVSWDVYGTLIATRNDEASDCADEILRARPGALEALTKIKERGTMQITSSDGELIELRNNLREAEIDRNFFEDLFQLEGTPKDYSIILDVYGIRPSELLVIGDNYWADLSLAEKMGCKTLHFPEFEQSKIVPLDVERILEAIK